MVVFGPSSGAARPPRGPRECPSVSRSQTLILDDPVQHIEDFRVLHLVEALCVKQTCRSSCAVEDASLADLLCRLLLSTSSARPRRVGVPNHPPASTSLSGSFSRRFAHENWCRSSYCGLQPASQQPVGAGSISKPVICFLVLGFPIPAYPYPPNGRFPQPRFWGLGDHPMASAESPGHRASRP